MIRLAAKVLWMVCVSVSVACAFGACPPGQGEWVTAAGQPECRPCISLDLYDETTPLPRGCPALRAGIIWTTGADAGVAGELAAADRRAVELQATVDRLSGELVDSRVTGAQRLNECAGDVAQCVGMLGKVMWVGVGVLAGGVLVWAASE